MKEPITARDLFVISTLCTGFGVLLAWGLFYRWGSAPPSKAIDWSAWVQAIGSVIAIFAAVRIAGWQEARREEIRRSEHRAIAQAIASLLLPAAEEFAANVVSTRQRLDDFDRAYVHAQIGKPKVPNELIEELPRLSQLGQPGSFLLRAIYQAGELNKFINDEGYAKRDHRSIIESRVEKAATYCAEAIEGMHELLQ